MHHVRRAHDRAAVQLADALQAEAHAEHRHAPLAEVRGSRRSTVRRRRDGPGPGEMSTAIGRRARPSRRASPRRGGARSAPRPAPRGTARGCRRTSRSCRSTSTRVPTAQGSGAATPGSYCRVMPQSKSKRSRYTPPTPTKAPPSPLWVPVVMADAPAGRAGRDRRQLPGAAPGRHVEPLPDARAACSIVARLHPRHDVSLTAALSRRVAELNAR